LLNEKICYYIEDDKHQQPRTFLVLMETQKKGQRCKQFKT